MRRISGEEACSVLIRLETTGDEVLQQVIRALREELKHSRPRLLLDTLEVLGEKTMAEMGCHEASVLTLALCPATRMLTMRPSQAMCWDLHLGPLEARTLRVARDGSLGCVPDCIFSSDGSMALLEGGLTSHHLVDTKTGQRLHTLRGPRLTTCSQIDFCPTGKFIVAVYSHVDTAAVEMRKWTVDAGLCELHILCSEDSFAFSPNGEFLLLTHIDQSHVVQLWSSDLEEHLRTLDHGHGLDVSLNSCRTLSSFSPDSRQIVTGSSMGRVTIWDTLQGTQLCCFGARCRSGRQAGFLPTQHRVFTWSEQGVMELWATSGQRLFVLPFETVVDVFDDSFGFASETSLAFCFSSADHLARLWRTDTGQVLHVLDSLRYQGAGTTVSFSPHGDLVISRSERRLGEALVDTATGQRIRRLPTRGGVSRFVPEPRELPKWITERPAKEPLWYSALSDED